jgi:glycolate oxidase iron-sulfur subunit
MQTHFTPQQLANPDVAVTDRILRACVHCGFCTATCPTYLLTGDELDGPRGRIYLAKDMLEKDRPADATTVKHLDRCLTCLSCMTTCPSGVHYMHLLDHARRHIAKTYRRPFPDRLLRALLARVLPYTGRFRFALTLAGWVRPFRRLLPSRVRNLLELADEPRRAERFSSVPAPSASLTHRLKRVALLPGCVQPVLRPEINEATVRLLNRYGVDVIVAKGTGCCGALVHHLGREADAHAQAKADIDAWTAEIEARGLDAIMVTASGCGTMLKDYGFIFRNDPAYAAKAERVSSLARDVSEVLAELPLERRTPLPTMRIAYHSACSLQHGQKLDELPAALLRRVGFNIVSIPESHLCCGSAGTYNLLEPDMASQLRARKVRNIESVHPDAIAAGNIGCLTQIAQGSAIPVVHTVELLDWATGGSSPADIHARAR